MKGIVIYSDGGAITNPGPAGTGLHGYVYSWTNPTRGTGNPKVVLTQKGYLLLTDFASQWDIEPNRKVMKDKGPLIPEEINEAVLHALFSEEKPYEVNVERYIDSYVAYADFRTNNYAELNGLRTALDYVTELRMLGEDIRYVTFISDSAYVINGANQYLPKWADQNYIKGDGNPIANEEIWRLVDHELKSLRADGVMIDLQWIKGHEGHLGNEKADELATIATNIALGKQLGKSDDESNTLVSEAQGYWKSDVVKPELIFNRYVLYNPTLMEHGQNPEVYFTCNTSEGLRFLGNKQSDAGFSLLTLKELIDNECVNALNDVMRKQAQNIDYSSLIVAVDTKTLFTEDTMLGYRIAGVHAFSTGNDYRKELYTPHRQATRENITQVINPPYISYRVEDIRVALSQIYDNYIFKTEGLMVTDITDTFFETVESKKGTKTQLKADKKVGHSREIVEALYDTTNRVDNNVVTGYAKVILVLGQDLPDRNTLKRIEEKNPRVKLLTWPEAPHVFSYAVLIETDEGWILSCGYFSNTRILSPKEISGESKP